MDSIARRIFDEKVGGIHWTKLMLTKRPDGCPPTIINAKAFNDFTIIATFDNGVTKKYDMQKNFENSCYGHIYNSIKNDSEKFVESFTFDQYGVMWDDEADLSENTIWIHGEIIENISLQIDK